MALGDTHKDIFDRLTGRDAHYHKKDEEKKDAGSGSASNESGVKNKKKERELENFLKNDQNYQIAQGVLERLYKERTGHINAGNQKKALDVVNKHIEENENIRDSIIDKYRVKVGLPPLITNRPQSEDVKEKKSPNQTSGIEVSVNHPWDRYKKIIIAPESVWYSRSDKPSERSTYRLKIVKTSRDGKAVVGIGQYNPATKKYENAGIRELPIDDISSLFKEFNINVPFNQTKLEDQVYFGEIAEALRARRNIDLYITLDGITRKQYEDEKLLGEIKILEEIIALAKDAHNKESENKFKEQLQTAQKKYDTIIAEEQSSTRKFQVRGRWITIKPGGHYFVHPANGTVIAVVGIGRDYVRLQDKKDNKEFRVPLDDGNKSLESFLQKHDLRVVDGENLSLEKKDQDAVAAADPVVFAVGNDAQEIQPENERVLPNESDSIIGKVLDNAYNIAATEVEKTDFIISRTGWTLDTFENEPEQMIAHYEAKRDEIGKKIISGMPIWQILKEEHYNNVKDEMYQIDNIRELANTYALILPPDFITETMQAKADELRAQREQKQKERIAAKKIEHDSMTTEAREIAEAFGYLSDEQRKLILGDVEIPKTWEEGLRFLVEQKKSAAEDAARIEAFIDTFAEGKSFMIEGDSQHYRVVAFGETEIEVAVEKGANEKLSTDVLWDAFNDGKIIVGVTFEAKKDETTPDKKMFLEQIANGSFTTTKKEVADDMATWDELSGYSLKTQNGLGGITEYYFEKKEAITLSPETQYVIGKIEQRQAFSKEDCRQVFEGLTIYTPANTYTIDEIHYDNKWIIDLAPTKGGLIEQIDVSGFLAELRRVGGKFSIEKKVLEQKETIEPVEPPFTHKLYCKIPVNGTFNSIDARKASNGEQIFELLVQKEDHKAFLGISKDPSVQKYVFTAGNWEYYLNNPSVMLLNKPTSDTKKIQLVGYGEAELVNGVWQVIKPVAVKFLGDGVDSGKSKEKRWGIDKIAPADDIEAMKESIENRRREALAGIQELRGQFIAWVKDNDGAMHTTEGKSKELVEASVNAKFNIELKNLKTDNAPEILDPRFQGMNPEQAREAIAADAISLYEKKYPKDGEGIMDDADKATIAGKLVDLMDYKACQMLKAKLPFESIVAIKLGQRMQWLKEAIDDSDRVQCAQQVKDTLKLMKKIQAVTKKDVPMIATEEETRTLNEGDRQKIEEFFDETHSYIKQQIFAGKVQFYWGNDELYAKDRDSLNVRIFKRQQAGEWGYSEDQTTYAVAANRLIDGKYNRQKWTMDLIDQEIAKMEELISKKV